jgi:hypothetical protein
MTRARQAERQYAERHVHPVRTPKRLYQLGICAPKRPNLVMFANHAGDIVAPIGVVRTGQMRAGETDGRRKVVERAAQSRYRGRGSRGQRDFLE